MGAFHIVHVIPDKRLHILNGYNEVIKTIIWGLRCHGHEVTYAVNTHRDGARNVIFGASMASVDQINAWPDDTVIYNLEQVPAAALEPGIERKLFYLSTKFEIWDYSQCNVDGWKTINDQCRTKYVPIGYAPILESIDKAADQDIDVLIYGGPSENRLTIFTDLCLKGLSCVFCFGIYGQARDDFIARSKIVLNVGHSHAKIFSIVRVSYLLANRKAVVADLNPDMNIEPDMFEALQFSTRENFTRTCLHYAHDEEARRQLEENAFNVMQKRDIRRILTDALQ